MHRLLLFRASILSLGLGLALAAPGWSTGNAAGQAVLSMGENGNITVLTGELFTLQGNTAEDFEEAAAAILGLSAEDLEGAVEVDEEGLSHARFAQSKNGLEVVGGDITVHADQAGTVYAVFGDARGAEPVGPVPTLSPEEAAAAAAAARPVEELAVGEPRLTYLIGQDEALYLAYEVKITGTEEDTPVDEQVYIDAQTGAWVESHSQIHSARFRRVYHGANTTQIPGPYLACQEWQGCWIQDQVILAAFGASGAAYAFYWDVFRRDSWNGWGAPVDSTVHYGRSFNNAFWTGNHMVFGDGDGYWSGPWALGFDIVLHELTHGVTQTTAGLIYSGESGALNEATSDIMAATATAHFQGVIAPNVWMIGEEVYTPLFPGDALRYMDNPTRDNVSKDWYPSRYLGPLDNGGVHWNSGIANLAFKLMVTGGRHPRGQSLVDVPPVGLGVAHAWYRALRFYLPSSSSFRTARWATAQAAWDIFGAPTGNPYASNAVHAAWDAVGVPR